MPAVAINSFTAPLLTISEGDSVTLSWNVSNATEVSISPDVGTVTATGSVVVSPDETTVYTLTATGVASTAAASLTITVQPAAFAITLTPNIDLTGFIRSSGSVTTGDLFVGDDVSDRGIQAFLTYDISLIPDHAVITRVIVDLSGYEVPYSSPYPDLGCLGAYVHDYTTLHGEYWWGDVPAPIGEWCSLDELDAPRHWTGFRNALQQRIGSERFQVRLQFADMESDGDVQRDLLHWPRPALPRLTIEYYT